MLAGENLGLVTNKQVSSRYSFQHAIVSELPTELHIFETAHASAYLFPLYLYTPDGRKVNFTQKFKDFLKTLYPQQPTPEEVFYYIYAVLYSPSYREKYAEFLKYEFPRIPFPKDIEKLKELSELGKKLANLHLLKDPSLNTFSVKFH